MEINLDHAGGLRLSMFLRAGLSLYRNCDVARLCQCCVCVWGAVLSRPVVLHARLPKPYHSNPNIDRRGHADCFFVLRAVVFFCHCAQRSQVLTVATHVVALVSKFKAWPQMPREHTACILRFLNDLGCTDQ